MCGNTYPFIYLSLETGEMIAGKPFILLLYLMESMLRKFYMCQIFKITNWHHPLESFVKSFSMADRDNPGNF